MIAVDTNILIYAHREDTTWHEPAFAALGRLAESREPWAIPWPCLHKFLAVVTDARVFDPPSPQKVAADQVDAWVASPSLRLLSETKDYWDELRIFLKAGRVSGARVHDARVAALCRHHGVAELWTADSDFGRFPGLAVRNPLVEP